MHATRTLKALNDLAVQKCDGCGESALQLKQGVVLHKAEVFSADDSAPSKLTTLCSDCLHEEVECGPDHGKIVQEVKA